MFTTEDQNPCVYPMDNSSEDVPENVSRSPRLATKRLSTSQMSDDKMEDMSGRKKTRNYLDTHKNIEKRRRDRINNCLNTLKTLVPECRAYTMSAYAAKKLDKAEILEMTIDYLNKIQQVRSDGLPNDSRVYMGTEQLVTELCHWIQQEKQCQNTVEDFTHSLLNHLQSFNTRSRFDNLMHNPIKSEPVSPPWNNSCNFTFPGFPQEHEPTVDGLDSTSSPLLKDRSPDQQGVLPESRCSSASTSCSMSQTNSTTPSQEPDIHHPESAHSISDFIKSLSQRNASGNPYPQSHQHQHYQRQQDVANGPQTPSLIPALPDRQTTNSTTPNHQNHFRFQSPPSSPFPTNQTPCGCSCSGTNGSDTNGTTKHNHHHHHPQGYQPTPVHPPSNAQSAAHTIQNLQQFITQQLNLPGASQALLNSWATLTSNLVAQTLQQHHQQLKQSQFQDQAPQPVQHLPQHNHRHQNGVQQSQLHHLFQHNHDLRQHVQLSHQPNGGTHSHPPTHPPLQQHMQFTKHQHLQQQAQPQQASQHQHQQQQQQQQHHQNTQQQCQHHQQQEQPHQRSRQQQQQQQQTQQQHTQQQHTQQHHFNHQQQQRQRNQHHYHHKNHQRRQHSQIETQQQQQQSSSSSSPQQVCSNDGQATPQKGNHFELHEQNNFESSLLPCNGRVSTPNNVTQAQLSPPQSKDDQANVAAKDVMIDQAEHEDILNGESRHEATENHPPSISSASFADLLKALEANTWPNGTHGIDDEDDNNTLLGNAPSLQDIPVCLQVQQ